MKKYKFIILLMFLFLSLPVISATRNSYTKYAKHILPNEFDPYFIENFSNCKKSEYIDWTGTYKYVILGKNQRNLCEYKTQYNPWLRVNKNEWEDYKICYFNDIQMNELTVALKEHSNRISTQSVGIYKTTGTKIEALLYLYEYNGACKLVKKERVKVRNY